jgi:hypothetical protein
MLGTSFLDPLLRKNGADPDIAESAMPPKYFISTIGRPM